jgi:hypothetical protein
MEGFGLGWLSFPQSQTKEQGAPQPSTAFSLDQMFSILGPNHSSTRSRRKNASPAPSAALHPDTFEPMSDDETEDIGDYGPDFAFEHEDW